MFLKGVNVMSYYENLVKEYTKIKKKQLSYIQEIFLLSSNNKLTEFEKIQMFRKLSEYDFDLSNLKNLLRIECKKEIIEKYSNINSINDSDYSAMLRTNLVEFDLDDEFLKNISFDNSSDEWLFYSKLGIDRKTNHYCFAVGNLLYDDVDFNAFFIDYLLNGQKLIEKPIYIFFGYTYDDFPFSTYPTVAYTNICSSFNINKNDNYHQNKFYKSVKIKENEISLFEKDNFVIPEEKYMHTNEIQNLFFKELLDSTNVSIKDCVDKTIQKSQIINYRRSPEYREKLLLDKISELYGKVHGDFISEELLYCGDFLDLIRELYQLPNGKVISKEKVVKNKGKDSVIILATNENGEFLITFQNRIKDQILAEFPAGYVEDGEEVIEAAKRELLEETGYSCDNFYVVDSFFTSPGIDNSTTYMVIANNCILMEKVKNTGSEFLSYDFFSDLELKYLITHNIMNGAMNRLVYYSLVHPKNHFKADVKDLGKVYRMEKEKLEL